MASKQCGGPCQIEAGRLLFGATSGRRKMKQSRNQQVMIDCPTSPQAEVPGSLWRFAQVALLAALALIGQQAVAQTMAVPQPTHGLMPNPGAGKGLYEKKCASCHGADLKGTKVGPPLLHQYYVPSHHSDVSFQIAVKNGVPAHHWQFGDMPAVPNLSPDDVAHITAYIRAQQRRVGIQ